LIFKASNKKLITLAPNPKTFESVFIPTSSFLKTKAQDIGLFLKDGALHLGSY